MIKAVYFAVKPRFTSKGEKLIPLICLEIIEHVDAFDLHFAKLMKMCFEACVLSGVFMQILKNLQVKSVFSIVLKMKFE